MMTFDLSRLDAALRGPAEEVLAQIGVKTGLNGISVTAKKGENGLHVSLQDGILIEYQELCQFFRGLALAKRVLRSGNAIEEHPAFARLFFGEDLSRGAVLTMESMKKKRDDMPWIETEEDAEFTEFIKSFNKNQRPQIIELLEKYKDKQILIFKNREEADEFILNL